ncbi:MAG: hypothetical protein ACRENL_07490 [Candidatus Dormibacteria bacterium]
MLGNFAEAMLTLVMVLAGPAGLALVVVLVWRLVKRRGGPRRGAANGEPPWREAPPIVHVVLSVLIGAAAAFISLEAYYGIVLAAATGLLLFRQARRQRWFALGGFLLGMGSSGAGFLSGALTNHDPAVTYDPSTVPFFWVGAITAGFGALTLVLAATRERTARSSC